MEKPKFGNDCQYKYAEYYEEEDRRILNDYYKAQTYYYTNLGEIYERFSNVLRKMSDIEVKEIIKNNLINPVKRL